MWARIERSLRRFPADVRGVAATEFAIGGGILLVGILNAIDVGLYEYRRMEVENAAQVGAQAAWKACDDTSTMLPATQNCPKLTSAVAGAIQSTSLGSAVSLTSGYPAEGYFCVNSSGVLQSVGTVDSTKPANCSAAGNSSTTPGDYLQVGVSYSYSPLFPASVIAVWGMSSIQMTSWMRLG